MQRAMRILVLLNFKLHVRLPVTCLNDVKVSLLLYPLKLRIVNRYFFILRFPRNDTLVSSLNQWLRRVFNLLRLRRVTFEKYVSSSLRFSQFNLPEY